MHKDARKSWNFPEGESTETVKILYSAAQRKAKRRHFVLCELSRLSLELNATHIHIFESVYKRARTKAIGQRHYTGFSGEIRWRATRARAPGDNGRTP